MESYAGFSQISLHKNSDNADEHNVGSLSCPCHPSKCLSSSKTKVSWQWPYSGEISN